ncbi:aliphatic sulfonate ABC transporter substrate-binding protein [Desmonostoc muscorum LEGE 12446]|uniref:Putative aliphatic sulfonates-binding protein n=1 Tax=Desmonostoc muscorum LEGE 12446 TaxID=1828758 RepID=A0A8J6ZMQ4_DESMC|nr:aliphatic sulfonate ABC transporter substrate-binding protein [Desmonostoc muscorum]MCF2146281.1 aliphatic sulfonate ABC transporter substrate-binding protein [Desmonostoc muscorum LEGE 12446]
MISRLIDLLPRCTGQNILRSLRSATRTSATYRFAVRFCIGLVSILVLPLVFDDHAIAASESGNQFQLPKRSIIQLLETVGLFMGGIIFCVVLDRWFSQRSHQSSNTPLAEQARRLKQLKIGYPEGMTNLEVLRTQALLETRLRPFGLSVIWTSFLSASSLIEALSNGTIDFCGGGGTASIFSQAADHVFVRVAKEKYTAPKGQAILVPEDSPIQTLADLKGKKIAFDKGSSAHYILVRSLAKVGLDFSDIEPVYLTQPEALPRFRRGEIDAWVIWVPYTATLARSAYPGRSIADLESIFGDKASIEVPTYYYAVPELVRDYPDLLKVILEEVNEAGTWAKRQELEAVQRLAEHHEIDPSIVEILQKHSGERAIIPIDDQSLNALQHQANIFRDLNLIPERVNVKDGTYSLQAKQNWTY